MSISAVEVARAAEKAKVAARAARVASRTGRKRSRLLCGQAAALRAKVRAAPGRTQSHVTYEAMLAELFASAELMDDLGRWPVDREIAEIAHRRILERYANFGPSLPN